MVRGSSVTHQAGACHMSHTKKQHLFSAGALEANDEVLEKFHFTTWHQGATNEVQGTPKSLF